MANIIYGQAPNVIKREDYYGKSGWDEFAEGLKPGLEKAFQLYLATQLQKQQYEGNIQKAYQMSPESFTPDYEGAVRGQRGVRVNLAEGYQPTPEMWQDIYKTQSNNAPIPSKFLKFKSEGMGKEFNPVTGEMTLKTTTPDLLTQLANYKNLKDTGLLPEGFDITGVSGKNVNVGRNVQAEKFEAEQAEKKSALDVKSQFIMDEAQDALNTIAKAKEGIDKGYFGLYGVVPAIPGTDKYTWQANIEKLLSGKMIDLMTQMKEASKTGATGFGQLSEKEGQILRNASTALKRGIKPEEAKTILDVMEKATQKIISGQSKPQGQGEFSTMSDEELRRIASGG